MPTALPALHGTFGNTEYWVTTMNVGELIQKVRFPQDLDGWADMSIEEKYQREISINRVRREIAPYFATDAARFSGALVLAVMNNEEMLFEPLSSIGGGSRSSLPQLYQSAAKEMGFLTFQGQEVLVPLDGQHRAKAFKFAIDGADDSNRPIPGVKADQSLARDQVSVILVRFDSQKARYIFNKLNRYAKATTKSDNIIIDDDDAIAVINRRLLGENGVIPARLVRIGGNTLPANAPEFTTLATLYECNFAIIKELGIMGHGSPKNMDDEQRRVVADSIRAMWERLLSRVDLWAQALSDSSERGDHTRIRIREETLLGKPIGQLSLVRGYLLMREKCVGISDDTLCERLNRIDWGVEAPMWHGVLMNPNGRVMSGKGTVNNACDFIAHLGGAKLTEYEERLLLEHLHGPQWREQGKRLPDPVG